MRAEKLDIQLPPSILNNTVCCISSFAVVLAEEMARTAVDMTIFGALGVSPSLKTHAIFIQPISRLYRVLICLFYPKTLRNIQELLNAVEGINQAQNGGITQVFFLPMAVAEGSPVHPAYPSGHSINLGAYITVLKVTSADQTLKSTLKTCM